MGFAMLRRVVVPVAPRQEQATKQSRLRPCSCSLAKPGSLFAMAERGFAITGELELATDPMPYGAEVTMQSPYIASTKLYGWPIFRLHTSRRSPSYVWRSLFCSCCLLWQSFALSWRRLGA